MYSQIPEMQYFVSMWLKVDAPWLVRKGRDMGVYCELTSDQCAPFATIKLNVVPLM